MSPESNTFQLNGQCTWRCDRHRGVPISDCRSRAGGCGGRACAVDGGLQTQGSWAGHGRRGNSGGEARTSQGCWGLYFHLSHALFLKPDNQFTFELNWNRLIIAKCNHIPSDRLLVGHIWVIIDEQDRLNDYLPQTSFCGHKHSYKYTLVSAQFKAVHYTLTGFWGKARRAYFKLSSKGLSHILIHRQLIHPDNEPLFEGALLMLLLLSSQGILW